MRYGGDWSSDVCSSDLSTHTSSCTTQWPSPARWPLLSSACGRCTTKPAPHWPGTSPTSLPTRCLRYGAHRSEERRVGKECTSRSPPNQQKTKIRKKGEA